MSPQGKTLCQQRLRELAEHENICILCGHYEGVDQRLLDAFIDEEISIGDYVLTGGELPAMVFADALCRMVPGVLSNNECFTEESHFSGLLEYPQYTKPAEWRGREVPGRKKAWRSRVKSVLICLKIRIYPQNVDGWQQPFDGIINIEDKFL